MPNRPGSDDRTTATGGLGDRGQNASIGNVNQSSANNANGAQPSGSARTRSNRGFASMDRGKQKEIASKGGKAAHAKGTAHEFDSGEAREAGRKGGMAVSRNREHMAAIGRRGGEARGQSRTRAAAQSNTGGTGSTLEGSFQNSRGGSSSNIGSNTERQVAINNNSEGVRASSQGTQGGNSSLGGERRPLNSDNATRDESFGR
jgi:general stress protein YciG